MPTGFLWCHPQFLIGGKAKRFWKVSLVVATIPPTEKNDEIYQTTSGFSIGRQNESVVKGRGRLLWGGTVNKFCSSSCRIFFYNTTLLSKRKEIHLVTKQQTTIQKKKYHWWWTQRPLPTLWNDPWYLWGVVKASPPSQPCRHPQPSLATMPFPTLPLWVSMT